MPRRSSPPPWRRAVSKCFAQGALATEIRFDVAVTRALRVTFDVVTYADGSVSTKVGFQNDAAMGATGGAILFNSLSIVEGGTTRFSKTNLTQYQFRSGRRTSRGQQCHADAECPT